MKIWRYNREFFAHLNGEDLASGTDGIVEEFGDQESKYRWILYEDQVDDLIDELNMRDVEYELGSGMERWH